MKLKPKLFRRAADAGSSEAKYELARSYKYGDDGLEANREEYLRLSTLFAEMAITPRLNIQSTFTVKTLTLLKQWHTIIRPLIKGINDHN